MLKNYLLFKLKKKISHVSKDTDYFLFSVKVTVFSRVWGFFVPLEFLPKSSQN